MSQAIAEERIFGMRRSQATRAAAEAFDEELSVGTSTLLVASDSSVADRHGDRSDSDKNSRCSHSRPPMTGEPVIDQFLEMCSLVAAAVSARG
jgi:hypothetical protein